MDIKAYCNVNYPEKSVGILPVEVYWKHLKERNIEDVWKSSVRRKTWYRKPVDHHFLFTGFSKEFCTCEFSSLMLLAPSGTIGTNFNIGFKLQVTVSFIPYMDQYWFPCWTITLCPWDSPFYPDTYHHTCFHCNLADWQGGLKRKRTKKRW